MTLFQLVVVVLLVAFALYVGRIVAKHSIRTENIHGGNTAEQLHLIACTLFAAIAPSILIAAFVFHLGLGAFLWGVTLFGLIFLCLIAFAYFELPARAKAKRSEDKGWTAEDARTSGL